MMNKEKLDKKIQEAKLFIQKLYQQEMKELKAKNAAPTSVELLNTKIAKCAECLNNLPHFISQYKDVPDWQIEAIFSFLDQGSKVAFNWDVTNVLKHIAYSMEFIKSNCEKVEDKKGPTQPSGR